MILRCALVPLFLAMLLPVCGQDHHALLWHISSDGPVHGYLYGTVHSRDARAFTYVRSVEGIMPQVRTVAGELDPDEAAGGVLALMSAMLLPDGKRVTDLYDRKKDRVLVEQAMRERIGPMVGMFMRMKPFFVMAAMMENDLGTDRPTILDSHLLNVAQDGGNRVIGLETMKEQIDAIDAASLKEQAKMLIEYLRDPGQAGDMEALLNAYEKQDITALQAIAEKSGSMPDAMERALIGDRNRVMVHRMDSVLRTDTTAMFLVGALHLPGADGVPALLREQGYRVEPAVLIADDLMPRAPGIAPEELGPKTYMDRQHGFRIRMYGEPEVAEDDESITITSMAGTNASVVIKEKNASKGGLDARVGELLNGAQGALVHVQGVEGRRVVFTEDGREMEFLFLVKDGHLWLVIVGDSDAQRREQVLDSFRFTDLPE